MAAFHFVANAVEHVFEREQTRFFGHSRVEHDLELEIAEFVGKRVHILPGDRVSDFVGFLDRVGRDRLERLDSVPFAAAHGVAQPAHDVDEPLNGHQRPLARCIL